jgi:hypothetical protein
VSLSSHPLRDSTEFFLYSVLHVGCLQLNQPLWIEIVNASASRWIFSRESNSPTQSFQKYPENVHLWSNEQ